MPFEELVYEQADLESASRALLVQTPVSVKPKFRASGCAAGRFVARVLTVSQSWLSLLFCPIVNV